MKRLLTYLICFLILSCQSKNDNSENIEMNNSDSLETENQEKKNQLDTLLNTDDYLILGDKLAKVKVVTENKVVDFSTFEILIGYRNDVIIGENIDYNNLNSLRIL